MQHEEDAHQMAVIQWSELFIVNLPGSPAHGHKVRDYLFAIANGGKRPLKKFKGNKKPVPLEGKRLKGLGVTPGIMDLMLAIPTEDYPGLFIEMKRPATSLHKQGSTSKAQKGKILLFREIGYKVIQAYGSAHATEGICDYLR